MGTTPHSQVGSTMPAASPTATEARVGLGREARQAAAIHVHFHRRGDQGADQQKRGGLHVHGQGHPGHGLETDKQFQWS